MMSEEDADGRRAYFYVEASPVTVCWCGIIKIHKLLFVMLRSILRVNFHAQKRGWKRDGNLDDAASAINDYFRHLQELSIASKLMKEENKKNTGEICTG